MDDAGAMKDSAFESRFCRRGVSSDQSLIMVSASEIDSFGTHSDSNLLIIIYNIVMCYDFIFSIIWIGLSESKITICGDDMCAFIDAIDFLV